MASEQLLLKQRSSSSSSSEERGTTTTTTTTLLLLQRALAAPAIKERRVFPLKSASQRAVNEAAIEIMAEEKEKEKEKAFYMLDIGALHRLWKRWVELLPGVQVFYAVKCNPEAALLSALAAFGSGFDCASPAEIDAVMAVGVTPDRIVYANPCKPESHVRYAAAVGVNLTTFDSVHEVDKIRRAHPKCSLLLRIRVPEDKNNSSGVAGGGGEGGARCPLGTKYGALAEEVNALLEAARRAGMTVAGVSFHVGSGATSAAPYATAVAAARHVFNTAAALGMPKLRILNVGGGFTAGARFTEAAATLVRALRTHFFDCQGQGQGQGHVTLMSEPGRYFAESAFWLVTSIIGKRVRGGVREYWINDGVYGSMNCLLYDHAVVTALPLAWRSRPNNVVCCGFPTFASTVFGPTCDALDTVLTDCRLPDLAIGDSLVFPNMGAYTAAAGSNFNGFSTSSIKTYLCCSPTT